MSRAWKGRFRGDSLRNRARLATVSCTQAARAGLSKVFSLSPHGERVGVRGGLAGNHIKRGQRF
ncbi:conserved protein of unknown function [Cupriavidus neocaledonicus]|uniref:Uncharacterized protein n=1 Tax=Cupriavidus neocaledonicus TaxID=1040979 RepID=A0A375H203_9BURK|nr:hypothetical protein CBM2605_A60588 [Cupriavidus neocaledonicus]SPD45921.1 conserved protein of unknown function [Cupriavidus neocaledonicus]